MLIKIKNRTYKNESPVNNYKYSEKKGHTIIKFTEKY